MIKYLMMEMKKLILFLTIETHQLTYISYLYNSINLVIYFVVLTFNINLTEHSVMYVYLRHVACSY